MPSTLPSTILQIRDFQLDCGRFELRRNGHSLRIERKPMELLILLATREGQLVTRAEIAQHLWSSEVFVDTEHGINTAIRKLRYCFRDDPDDPQYIQTVPGMGYRLIAPVSPVEPVAAAAAVAPAAAVALPLPSEGVPEPASPTGEPALRKKWVWYAAAGACLLLALASVAVYRWPHRPPEVQYTQLTDFTDSAVAPALSPDGHMVAFIRGSNGFLTTDQIYIKMLPNGEPRRLTDDVRPKYGLAFSPDGSEIAYTVLESAGFSTYEVSALGGEPQLLLKNAAGLVWLDPQRLLFSEIRSGLHMGVVTATPTRADLREIYFPAHERGMAHYASPSPDRRWALVVEMNGDGSWGQCRLVALEGQSSPRLVGPAGACTSAGWSPDGGWMYFTAWVEGRTHVWRQRFPEGEPEQITFGPTEEEGVAVQREGRALITSVGVQESAIWIHEGTSERPLSSEGEVVGYLTPPVFSADASVLYYLLQQGEASGAELWRTAVDSGKSEAVFPGISMTAFDLSPDGKQVVYTTAGPGGTAGLWLAPVDRSSPATKVNISGALSPHFGAHGQILFLHTEGTRNYLERIDPDGSHRSKVFSYPLVAFQGVSPSRRWITAAVPRTPEKNFPAIMAIPLDGGAPRQICASYCKPRWSMDGTFLFVPVEESSRTSPGRSLAIPVGPGESLPDFPAGGIAPLAEPSVVPGAESVGRGDFVPGKDREHYAWVNTTVHRNLYQISLP